ncbi:hypothetical protein [Actinoplanes sp. NPDC051411]|uniref:hypothetical protein n=1 Tax=Actinoplanes sp. NPDC051411 TaxID=3155522 RepID=UPI003442E695
MTADLPDRPPAPTAAAIEPVVGDRAWAQAVLDVLAALARARARVGAVPAQTAAVITRSARTEFFHPRLIASAARDAADPVTTLAALLTRLVAELDPPSAEHVHGGPTGPAILDTATMTVAHRALTVIDGHLGGALTSSSGPGTAEWPGLLRDARCRLRRVRDEGLPVAASGLDGYALPGTRDDLVDAFAAEIGLSRPGAPARTAIAGLGSALAVTAGALGRIAAGGARVRDPVRAAQVLSATRQVPPLAAGLSRPAGGRRAEWRLLRECLRLTGTAAETAVSLLRVVEVARS